LRQAIRLAQEMGAGLACDPLLQHCLQTEESLIKA